MSVMPDSVWPHRWQPTRLLHPWDSPGKNTRVGCHFLLQCMKVKIESEVAWLCPTLHCLLQENDNRNIRINNYFKCKWIKCFNWKTQTAEWIQKQDPNVSCLQETHFRPQDTYRLKVRGCKNIFHANGKQKKAGVAIFISDKIDLKIRNIQEIRKDTT